MLASVALLAAVVSAILLGLAAWQHRRASASLLAVRRLEMRYRAWSREQGRFIDMRTSIANAATSTTDAVQLGSSITKAGHQAIADIPFGILGAIPATREGSKRVKGVHDGIADAVYSRIAGASEGIGRLTRRRLTGEDGSALPEQPTPPALPPD